jgi:hypothetical protein
MNFEDEAKCEEQPAVGWILTGPKKAIDESFPSL